MKGSFSFPVWEKVSPLLRLLLHRLLVWTWLGLSANYRRTSNPINWGHPVEGSSLAANRFSRGHGARLADSVRQWSICSSMLRQSLFFSFANGKDTDLPCIRSRSMFPPSGTVFIQNWSGEKNVCRFFLVDSFIQSLCPIILKQTNIIGAD